MNNSFFSSPFWTIRGNNFTLPKIQSSAGRGAAENREEVGQWAGVRTSKWLFNRLATAHICVAGVSRKQEGENLHPETHRSAESVEDFQSSVCKCTFYRPANGCHFTLKGQLIQITTNQILYSSSALGWHRYRLTSTTGNKTICSQRHWGHVKKQRFWFRWTVPLREEFDIFIYLLSY